MEPISATTVIDCPRARAFELIGDLSNRPAFTDHFIEQFRLERLDSTGLGASARFRVAPPGARLWMETVVEETDPPHLIRERGRGGRLDRIPIFTCWELHAGPGDATEITVTFWTEPSDPLDRLRERLGARRWWRRQWGRALRRLKELLESGGPVERVRVGGADRIPTLPAEVRE